MRIPGRVRGLTAPRLPRVRLPGERHARRPAARHRREPRRRRRREAAAAAAPIEGPREDRQGRGGRYAVPARSE